MKVLSGRSDHSSLSWQQKKVEWGTSFWMVGRNVATIFFQPLEMEWGEILATAEAASRKEILCPFLLSGVWPQESPRFSKKSHTSRGSSLHCKGQLFLHSKTCPENLGTGDTVMNGNSLYSIRAYSCTGEEEAVNFKNSLKIVKFYQIWRSK